MLQMSSMHVVDVGMMSVWVYFCILSMRGTPVLWACAVTRDEPESDSRIKLNWIAVDR